MSKFVSAGVALTVTTGLSLTAVAAQASPTSSTWSVNLHGGATVNIDRDSSDISLADPHASALAGPYAQGSVVTATHHLADPATSVDATVHADIPPGAQVIVDIRARKSDGRWSEWLPAGSALPQVTETVQARITLVAGPHAATPLVHDVTLAPSDSPRPRATPPTAAPRTANVFATREGLVGGTTANGHVIVSRDHFVALPSRRGLATKDGGNYTVRICATNGRCEWAPVWDVGPWNTHDDYWNTAGQRESWSDLPQGTPEAQAANQQGYNGGKDEFGRTVTNPAGIDLADGTFWDGLKLTDNAWVTVTYLWTGPSTATGQVSTLLNARKTPGGTAIGLAAEDAVVPISCQVHAGTVHGQVKTTDLWDQLAPGYYVSDAYVDTGSTGAVAPICS